MAGWLFLAAALVGAALVANVYRPTLANVRLGFVSFFLGWLEAELAIHHILWQGIATAIFIYFGALESTPGQLALGVTLVQISPGRVVSDHAGEPDLCACTCRPCGRVRRRPATRDLDRARGVRADRQLVPA